MTTAHTTQDLSAWTDLRVAITGGTSGLGLALVETLAARGAKVAFVARNATGVAEVSARVDGAFGIVGDVSRKDEIYPIAMNITTALGGLDMLINNASSLGPVPLVPLVETECEDLELALATNLVGPFRLTKALMGALTGAAREGRTAQVVNISSDAAVNAYPTWGAYGASKAGLAHLSRVWDAELRDSGVRVLALDPGDMDTPLHALAVPDANAAELKQPADAAVELLATIEALFGEQEVAA